MWPWGHAAVGYLLWVALLHRFADRQPSGAEIWALGFGTQFPDLVDKPLAWSFGLLPSGRSLAHSLPVAALVVAAAYVLCRRRGREVLAVAFGVGYVGHSLSDTLSSLLTGEYDNLTYLAWPLLPAPTYENGPIQSNGLAVDQIVVPAFEVALVAVALVHWTRVGTPGLAGLRSRLGGVG